MIKLMPAAYTVTINSGDNGTVTAANLNRINTATTGSVNLTNVTAIGGSNLSDLTTINAQRAGFSNIAGVAGITLTDDGGGGDGDVNFGDLDTIVNSYQDKQFQYKCGIQFPGGDTIDIDSSDELSAYLTDIGSGALVLTNQNVTVDSSVGVSVANAKSIAADTSGTVTATIASGSRVSKLTELRDPDGAGEVEMKKMHGQSPLIMLMQQQQQQRS